MSFFLQRYVFFVNTDTLSLPPLSRRDPEHSRSQSPLHQEPSRTDFLHHLHPAVSHKHTTGSLISFSLSAISFTCFLFHPSPLVKNIVRFVCMSLSCITVTLWKRKGARITQPSSDIHLLSIYLLTFFLPRPSRGQGVASPDCASRILHSSLFILH